MNTQEVAAAEQMIRHHCQCMHHCKQVCKICYSIISLLYVVGTYLSITAKINNPRPQPDSPTKNLPINLFDAYIML